METTNTLLASLANTLTDQYAAQLAKMPIKKNVREALVDGFRSGAHAAAGHTCAMLGATVHENDPAAQESEEPKGNPHDPRG